MEFDRIDTSFPSAGRTGMSQLQSRYVVPFAGCVFAAIFIVGLVLSMRSRDLLVEQLKNEQLSSARAGAQALGNQADSLMRMVEALSKSSLTAGTDYGAIKSRFTTMIENVAAVESLYLYNSNQKVITSTSTSGELVRTVSADACFDKVRAGASYCFSNMYRTENGGMAAYLYMPVFNDGGTASRVIAGGLNLNDKLIQNIVMGINPGKKGFSYLVDRSRKLVLTGDTAKDDAIKDVSSFEPVEEVLAGKRGSIIYKYGRKPMLATFYPVEPLGWGLVIQRPKEEVGEGAAPLYSLVFIFLVIGTAAAAGVALVQAQGVTRFLALLTNRMDAIASGKRNQSIPSEEASGMNRLARSFNRMVTMIEEGWLEGNRELEDVRKTAQFNASLLSSIKDLFLVTDPRLKIVLINDKAEVFVPAETRPAMGRFMSDMGHAWGQRRLQEAAQRAIDSGEVISLSNVRFTTPDRADTAIFDFRIYPVSSTEGVLFYGREVSDFVARHEKVQNSERFFREVATDLGDPLIVIDAESKVEWINPAAAHSLHLDDNTLGKSWFDFISEKYKDVMLNLMDNAPEGDTQQAPDEVVFEHAGLRLRMEVAVGSMLVGESLRKYVLTLRSVPTSRLVARDALRLKPKLENKVKFLTTVIESIPEVLAIVGLDGRFIMVNSAFADMFREKKEVLIGKQIDVLHAEGGPLVDLASVARDGFFEKQTTVKTLRGDTFKASVSGAVVQNGTHIGYVLTVRETESEEKNRIYEKRMLESQTRSRMARTVAARFESIVASLGDSLHGLGKNIFAEETRSMWLDCMAHCKDLSLAANSLHMYAVDSSVSLQACNINEIVENTVDQLGSRGFIPPSVSVQIACPENLPVLNADSGHMMMVTWHLLKNAVEAAAKNPKGGEIMIRAYDADIDGAHAAIVEVLDNGLDYNPEETERFFDPFYGTKSEGMGLGLTLARRAVLKHSGRIGIQRAEGITRASFYIPFNLTPKRVAKSTAQ